MKEIIQFNVADRELFEEYLNTMSEQGYVFKSMDAYSVTFKKSDNKKYYYVDLYEKIPYHDQDFKKEERQKQIDLYAEMGLNLKHMYDHFMIYESDKKVKIHTDEEIEKKLIKETKSRILEMNSKWFAFMGVFETISFLIIAYLEKLSYIIALPFALVFLLTILYMNKKNKVIDSKKVKTIADQKFKGKSYLYIMVMLVVTSCIPFLLTSSNMIIGLIQYIKAFGSTLLLVIMFIVFSKYDVNKGKQKTIIWILLFIIFIVLIELL